MNLLAVDIGGTFIKYARMDETCAILAQGKVPTPKEGREALIEALGSLYDSMPEVEGIAISMAGILDSARGYCYMGGALAYNNEFALGDALKKRCPTRIWMENDAKCAAMAEASIGALKDVSDGFVLIFGTMIGGGYVHDHRLIKGTHFSAGEVSYINTTRDGAPSFGNVFGNRCGTPRLMRDFAEKKGIPASDVDGIRFFEAVNAGDADAQACLTQYCREIAIRIFNLQTVLDVERFAIGGGISAQPVFIDTIRAQLQRLYEECPYSIPQVEVVPCAFRNDANLIGAVQCFLQNQMK